MPTIVYCYHLPSDDLPKPPLIWDAFESSGEPRRVGIVPKLLDTVNERQIFRSIAPYLNEVIATLTFNDDLTADEQATIISNGQDFPRTFIGEGYTPSDGFGTHAATCRVQDLDFQVSYDKVVMASAVLRTVRDPKHKCIDLVAMHAVKERIEQRRRNREEPPSERGRSLPFLAPAHKHPSIVPIQRSFLNYLAAKKKLVSGYDGPLPVFNVIGGEGAKPTRAAAPPAPAPLPPPPPPAPPRPPADRITGIADDTPFRRWRADIDG